MLPLLLLACVIPTTAGMHQDALAPPAGGGEVGLAVGRIRIADKLEEGAAHVFDLAQLQGSLGLGRGLALDASLGPVAYLYGGRVDLRWQLLGRDGEPLAFAVHAGPSVMMRFRTDDFSWGGGGQVGAVGSYEVHPGLRPYVGLQLVTSFVDSEPYPIPNLGLGLSWRTRLSDRVGLHALAEVDLVGLLRERPILDEDFDGSGWVAYDAVGNSQGVAPGAGLKLALTIPPR